MCPSRGNSQSSDPHFDIKIHVFSILTAGELHDPRTQKKCETSKIDFEWNLHSEISRKFKVSFFSTVYGRTLCTTHRSFHLITFDIDRITSPKHLSATQHNTHSILLHTAILSSPIQISAVFEHFFSSCALSSLVQAAILGR